jgi:hypothetical protein
MAEHCGKEGWLSTLSGGMVDHCSNKKWLSSLLQNGLVCYIKMVENIVK